MLGARVRRASSLKGVALKFEVSLIRDSLSGPPTGFDAGLRCDASPVRRQAACLSDLEIPLCADCHLWPVGKGKCVWRAARRLCRACAYEDLGEMVNDNYSFTPATIISCQ